MLAMNARTICAFVWKSYLPWFARSTGMTNAAGRNLQQAATRGMPQDAACRETLSERFRAFKIYTVDIMDRDSCGGAHTSRAILKLPRPNQFEGANAPPSHPSSAKEKSQTGCQLGGMLRERISTNPKVFRR